MTWVFAGILAYTAVQLMIGFWVSRFVAGWHIVRVSWTRTRDDRSGRIFTDA